MSILGASSLAGPALARGRGEAAQASGFVALLEAPESPAQYLVEITAFKGDALRTGGRPGLGAASLAAPALAATAPGGTSQSGTVELRYSDKPWTGDPTDADKPNIYYEARAHRPLDIERAIPIEPEQNPRIQRQFGAIEITNGDGELDNFATAYAVDGRRVRVLLGPEMGAYSDFQIIADLLGTGWEIAPAAGRLNVRDRRYALDNPLQQTVYAGTGSAEGTEENEGKPKPLAFGRCRNVTPVQIDPTNLVYQVHDGSIEAVDEVFERGASITLDTGVGTGGDVADYTALIGASITAGQYATALAEGLFRLGSSPSGVITADVRGDNDPDYQNTLDIIVLRILRSYAGVSSSFINSGSFAGLAALGGEMGIFIDSNSTPTFAQTIDQLVSGAGGFWGADRLGRIRGGRLPRPESQSPIYFFDQFNILDLQPEPVPVPRYRQRVGYKPNWTQQRGEDLAVTVTDARRQFLTETERNVTAIDTTVRTRHPQAKDPPPLFSFYESDTDAQSIADELLALHKQDRQIFQLTAWRIGFLFNLGQVVRVSWPRLGLSSGKNFAIVGLREEAATGLTIVRLWG